MTGFGRIMDDIIVKYLTEDMDRCYWPARTGYAVIAPIKSIRMQVKRYSWYVGLRSVGLLSALPEYNKWMP